MSQRSAYAGRGMNDYVDIDDVGVGQDSASGAAVRVYFPQLDTGDSVEANHWVPYSQIDKITRTHKVNGDSIRMSRWFARKIGLEV